MSVLEPGTLHRICDPASLGFETTADIEPLPGILGQEDAVSALVFGLSVPSPGYNLFVLGAPQSGKLTFVREQVGERAVGEPAPSDWCYVFNFQDPRRPYAVGLPPGHAAGFKQRIHDLIGELRDAIPAAHEGEDLSSRRASIIEEREREAAVEMDRFEREIELDQYVALAGDGRARQVVPARGGESVTRDIFMRFPEELRETIDEHVRAARDRLFAVQRRVHELEREARARVGELNRDATRSVVAHRVSALQEEYAASDAARAHLDRLAKDVVEHYEHFIHGAQEPQDFPAFVMRQDVLRRYEVNVLVVHEVDSGAPVIYEADPNLSKVMGRLERRMQFGAMVTDFTGIAAGALHRANGGYLVLEAEDVLARPLVWPALKRVLRTGQLTPTEPAAELGILVAESLEPEPIPLNVKVVLVGEPRLYYLLQALDDEFRELFKVKVDFRPYIERTPETERGYAGFIAHQTREESLPAFGAGGVAAVLDEACRLTGDQRKLSTRLGEILDLVREAAQQMAATGRTTVEPEDVGAAIAARERRNLRPHRELLDLIERDILAFEPAGKEVGRVYGIGLVALNETAFGRPIRVMASAYFGNRGLMQIEREAKLSGRIHSKGFLVLSGYVGRRFAREQPLVLSASLSFDQLYEEVEGDSASVAELYALLSAIGGVSLHQGVAVTGALNQEGGVLPVGGVTEKVEGFFDACERKGLTGEQGVILPRRSAQSLVLRPRVRTAVAEGRFSVWAIDRVEEGWPILAGMEAGEAGADGAYPPGTVHAAVMGRLSAWAAQWKALAAQPVLERVDRSTE